MADLPDAGLADLRRIGVLGGTFDPIHVGHLVAAAEALHRFRLDRVMFVPTGQPWQKRSYTDQEDRYLMTALGTSSNPRFAASRIELDRRGPTYTVDTMQALRDFHGPGVELFFILGADAALNLGTWARVEGLADLTEIIAATRSGFSLDGLRREPGWPRIHEMRIPNVEISSSELRARVRRGAPIDFLVPAPVVAYIREHGLYAGEPGRRPGAEAAAGA